MQYLNNIHYEIFLIIGFIIIISLFDTKICNFLNLYDVPKIKENCIKSNAFNKWFFTFNNDQYLLNFRYIPSKRKLS